MSPGTVGLDAFSLAGRRALVTGGGRGLGRAMASGLAAAGAAVAVVSRSAGEIEEVAARLGKDAVALAADVSDLQGLAELVDRAEARLGGTIDVVVHAAGVQHRQAAEEFDPVEWQRVIDVNLTAPFLLSQAIGRRQLAAGSRGSHIFIGSLSSRLSLPNVVAYTASKSAVFGVLRNLSTEWSGRGIRVNGIAPGYFHTKLTDAVFTDETRRAELLARIPMGRFGEPEELAGAAVFLASDASSYVTGQLLTVDGGWIAS